MPIFILTSLTVPTTLFWVSFPPHLHFLFFLFLKPILFRLPLTPPTSSDNDYAGPNDYNHQRDEFNRRKKTGWENSVYGKRKEQSQERMIWSQCWSLWKKTQVQKCLKTNFWRDAGLDFVCRGVVAHHRRGQNE